MSTLTGPTQMDRRLEKKLIDPYNRSWREMGWDEEAELFAEVDQAMADMEVDYTYGPEDDDEDYTNEDDLDDEESVDDDLYPTFGGDSVQREISKLPNRIVGEGS